MRAAKGYLLSLYLFATVALAVESEHKGQADVDQSQIDELIVVGSRALELDFEGLANFTVLSAEQAGAAARHPHDLFTSVPGVWVLRGSGQEHLTAIRSPVLTGPGACGSFLILEYGIPIRPTGFCNVNNLFEVDLAQVDKVEVVRGPASGLYGGNALHGVINVLPRLPTLTNKSYLYLEKGQWGLTDFRVSHNNRTATDPDASVLSLRAVETDGWRDGSGETQVKINASQTLDRGAWQILNSAAISYLDQQTAGFIVGEDAYKSNSRSRANLNPEAFRKAWAWRINSRLEREWEEGNKLNITSYLRRSEMRFRQHFLPGKPIESNGQISGGLLAVWLKELDYLEFRVGVQGEYWQGHLDQFQDSPAEGRPSLVATLPVGRHYDYEVTGTVGAVFYDLNLQPDWLPWSWIHTLRIEYLNYDYENRLLPGSTREDGTSCGADGCRYSRPSDRADDFVNVAGRVGFRYKLKQRLELYGMVGRGFRPPQATELYRLQSGQRVADLDSEILHNIELGLSGYFEGFVFRLAGYWQNKKQQILRDAEGLNISNGETLGLGLEVEVDWQITTQHSAHLALSQSKHEYDFTGALAGGEMITKGNEVDTAPARLFSLKYRYSPIDAMDVELELVSQGDYQLNAANTAEYEGHELLNAQVSWRPSSFCRFKCG